MPFDLLLGLASFAAVTCFTPGPNNAMLMASGLNFGIERTIPHVLGVALGFAFMVLAVALGIGRILAAWPEIYLGLRIVAVAYLLWLAWGIATAGSIEDAASPGARPLTFIEAAAFQWVNPKGWIMAVSASTTYAAAASTLTSGAIMSAVFGVLGFASSVLWAGGGAAMRGFLANPSLRRAINIALAVALVASLYPVISELRSAVLGSQLVNR